MWVLSENVQIVQYKQIPFTNTSLNLYAFDVYQVENKEIKAEVEPPRGVLWLKGRMTKDGYFPDEEIRSLG